MRRLVRRVHVGFVRFTRHRLTNKQTADERHGTGGCKRTCHSARPTRNRNAAQPVPRPPEALVLRLYGLATM
eukprot:6248860-Prymnesium_polylepis.1